MKKLPLGILASFLLHATLYGGALAWIAYDRAHPSAIDIDLRGSSLILRPHNSGALPVNFVPPQPWVLSNGRMAPAPQALTYTPKATTEAVGEACPPPCPNNPSDWLPASGAAEKPQIIGDFASPEERPAGLGSVAGQVDILWFISAQGEVVDFKILNSSDPRYTELVLKKIKQTRFRPGYDAAGNAIPVRIRMPVQFDAL